MFQGKTWIKMPKYLFWKCHFSGNTSVYVFITEIIWQTFDVIIDDPYFTGLLRLSHFYLFRLNHYIFAHILFKEFIKSLVFIIVLLALMGMPSLDHSQGQKSICLFVKVAKESWCSKPGIIVFLKKHYIWEIMDDFSN